MFVNGNLKLEDSTERTEDKQGSNNDSWEEEEEHLDYVPPF